ncbi:putative Glo1-Glyoxaloxidase 1 [Violaceomyces palustris]|uniref:Glo1-Glyoxaloxidase 1 n=1 Tax=Violaceomyces palustris TaxID=1673888 RepID=A0ACD0P5G7_9BASI|nr:putative Glo1-Glyoxaloxidase 1 [Violaceomyces palustris]
MHSFARSSKRVRRMLALAVSLSIASAPSLAAAAGGYGEAGGFAIINEDSKASAMMMGLANQDTVLILDKAENNTYLLSNGLPVWGSMLSLSDNSTRGIQVNTNTFCASGGTLGNGTWIVAGGNQAVGYGGQAVAQSISPYKDYDGTQAIRLMEPNSNGNNLAWIDNPSANGANMLTSKRWYPGIEVLEDGSVIFIGGATGGGYINRNYPTNDTLTQGGGANPTYEYFPATGKPGPAVLQFLGKTNGLNMYPHTFLMPSGRIFMQANYSTILWDHLNNKEEDLPDMPGQIVRVYPASGATAMLPLTPSNQYTPTILFCGGMYLDDPMWGNYSGPGGDILGIDASKDCSSIQPELTDGTTNPNAKYLHEEDLPDGRSMGQFIHLPTGQLVIVNGCSKGTAGYTNATWNTINPGSPNNITTEGLCQDPTYQPVMYDPELPLGSRLTTKGFGRSTIARLYHSSAILIPDGSILIAGSNPHQDVVLNMPTNTVPQAFNTTYEIEKWYPPYFWEPRPEPQGVPDYVMYGGDPFTITMDANYMGDSANYKAAKTKFMLIRPGFSTHAMNMGQRSLQLENNYVVNDDGSVTYKVNPLPPNANYVFVPGPALFFVTVNGVPSIGKYIMVGSTMDGPGPVPFSPKIGAALQTLPASSNSTKFTSIPSSPGSSSSSSFGLTKIIGIAVGGAAVFLVIGLGICLWRRQSNRSAAKASARQSAAPWTSRDIGAGGAEYKRVNTPSNSMPGYAGGFGSMGGRESTHTFDSYRMQDVSGGNESKEALGQYFDHPRMGSRGTGNAPSPLAYDQSRVSSPAPYQQHGWGEHHAGDAGAYYEDNADRYGGYEDHSSQYYDQPAQYRGDQQGRR